MAVVLVLNTVQGGGFIVLAVALQVRTGGNWSTKRSFTFLCTTVANFLREDWGKLVHKKKFYISLHCSCKFLNCAAIYTHSTTIIAKIYTPDSAIYSLQDRKCNKMEQ